MIVGLLLFVSCDPGIYDTVHSGFHHSMDALFLFACAGKPCRSCSIQQARTDMEHS